MKNFILIILSRLVQGFGIGLEMISLLWAGWFLFYSDNPLRYWWVALMAVVFIVGLLIFKFALDYIHEDTPDSW